MKLSTAEKLRRFLDQFSGEDHVLVLIMADPDSIASAMAVKRLLWRRTAGVTISHINVIKRPDNLAMIRLLNVNMVHINKLGTESFSKVVMVDSQPDHNEIFLKYQTDIVIDHHPDSGGDASFRDIRPKYGATATILTEYLKAAKIKPSAKLATGLFYAIKADTNNFQRQAQLEDIRAFQFLFRYANAFLATRIEQADLRVDFLEYFQAALENRRLRKQKAFVHLGKVVSPDICVIIADFFMRISSVNWSIVSGIHNSKLVIIFRNDGIRKNAGSVAIKGFGHIGSAGGHKSMSRAEIPIKELGPHVDAGDPKKLALWIIRRIENPGGKKRK